VEKISIEIIQNEAQKKKKDDVMKQ